MEAINNNQNEEINENKIETKLKKESNNLKEKEINLIYTCKFEGTKKIFGELFVENNKDNIELIINGEKTKLVNKYKLKKGENHITLIIKNKIDNLSNMFFKCKALKNIDELKYLNTEDCKDFSRMFNWCSSLSDINALEHWNVSNGTNFFGMFGGCSSLSNIKPLENWNVSNGNNFSYMFSECSLLSDVKPIEKWNVSKGNNFICMFWECSSLSNIKTLESWKLSKEQFKSLK